MCIHDLLDMYALSPRASGMHIRQIPDAHVTTITHTQTHTHAHMYTHTHIYIYKDSSYLLILPS